MSELIALHVLIRHLDASRLDRVSAYFRADSRPDFTEDVPKVEEEWVGAFEILPYPSSIEQPDPQTLLLEFSDDEDLGELPEDLARAINLSEPDLIISYSFLEDHALFEKWQDQRYEIVWDVDDIYDGVNQFLDEKSRKQLRKLESTPKIALLYLAQIL